MKKIKIDTMIEQLQELRKTSEYVQLGGLFAKYNVTFYQPTIKSIVEEFGEDWYLWQDEEF